MALTVEEFYNISGYTNTNISQASVEFFLSSFTEIIEKNLGYRLTTATVVEADKINYPAQNKIIAQSFFSVGAWQEAGLVVKVGSVFDSDLNTLTSSPLILGVDYDLFRFVTGFQRLPPTIVKPNPVVGIKLLGRALSPSYMLRLYGTWGFDVDIPLDIKMLIYTSLKTALEINQAGTTYLQAGGGGLSSGSLAMVQEYTTKVQFNQNDLLTPLLEYFTDFLSTKAAQTVLMPYKISFDSQLYQF
jgi:hypothetical protein